MLPEDWLSRFKVATCGTGVRLLRATTCSPKLKAVCDAVRQAGKAVAVTCFTSWAPVHPHPVLSGIASSCWQTSENPSCDPPFATWQTRPDMPKQWSRQHFASSWPMSLQPLAQLFKPGHYLGHEVKRKILIALEEGDIS